MKWLKLSIICSLSGAIIFGVFSLVFYYGDWSRFSLVTTIGFFVGLLSAPEFDRKSFKNPALFQVVSGSIVGAIAGEMFGLDVEGIIILLIAGGFLGWLSPYWIKYVTIP